MKETLFLKGEKCDDLNAYDFAAVKKALNMDRKEIIADIKRSGLKGRGGAGFPTGLKWELALNEESAEKYLICNGDEGEPGTFKDRYLMENRPLKILEGIIIAAFAVKANKGYIYIRGEYANCVNIFQDIIEEARNLNILGKNIFDSGFDFDLQVIKGAGAYVCGDETSLINSIEGKRGQSRIKPPYPIVSGLFGKPTVVNNVESLASVSEIIKQGVESYINLGTEESKGTKLVCLSGDVCTTGVYEVEFGKMTLREIIEVFGQGVIKDQEIMFVVPGGISTSILTAEQLDIPYSYESLAEAGTSLGSGAIIVAAKGHDLVDLMINVSRFFMDETCGTCFPCREGNRQIYHLLKKHRQKEKFTQKEIMIIRDIANSLQLASRCGLGQSSLNFINSMINNFQSQLLVRGEK